jgi:hypothetical protein
LAAVGGVALRCRALNGAHGFLRDCMAWKMEAAGPTGFAPRLIYP